MDKVVLIFDLSILPDWLKFVAPFMVSIIALNLGLIGAVMQTTATYFVGQRVSNTITINAEEAIATKLNKLRNEVDPHTKLALSVLALIQYKVHDLFNIKMANAFHKERTKSTLREFDRQCAILLSQGTLPQKNSISWITYSEDLNLIRVDPFRPVYPLSIIEYYNLDKFLREECPNIWKILDWVKNSVDYHQIELTHLGRAFILPALPTALTIEWETSE